MTNIPTTIITNKIIKPTYIEIELDCDINCLICNKKTGICYSCKATYNLINNKCIKHENIISTNININKEIKYEIENIIIKTDYNEQTIKIICDIENCLKCEKNQMCSKCNQNYYLKNNKCIKQCNDKNCEECSDDGNICYKCNKESKLYEGQCAIKCSNKNCVYCLQERKCIECDNNYIIKNNHCIKKENKIDYSILYLLLMLIGLIVILILLRKFLYKEKKESYKRKNHIELNEY